MTNSLSLSLQRIALLVATIVSIGAASSARAQTITTFDPPNSTTTIASSINLHGQITGSYADATSVHGFLRKRDGNFLTFDAFTDGSFPSNATALDINAAGQIIGYYENSLAVGSFLRRTNGTIVAFSPSESSRVNAAASPSAVKSPGIPCAAGAVAVAINDLGQIAGGWPGSGGNCSGYIRKRDGTITTFVVPSEFHSDNFIPTTNPRDISLFGQITGEYFDVDSSDGILVRGFVRQPNGAIVRFDVPSPNRTFPTAINLFGQIAGHYQDSSGTHGFLRHSNGRIVTFDPTGSSDTEPASINDLGQITGYYLGADGTFYGFLRNWDGSITTFDAPNSHGTFAQSINLFGQITGYYFDGSSYHGFVRSAH